MDGPLLEAFLDSPFNAAAHVRMYLFFAHLFGLALGVLLVLAGLSLVVQNVWCRYFCPYSGLLGVLSLASPLRITRTQATCIDCRRCTQVCPSRIQVHRAGRVGSDECTACYRCVAVTGLAMLSGHWRTSLSRTDYLQLVPAAEGNGQP